MSQASVWDAAHVPSIKAPSVPARLFTDEDPATTIKGLGFRDADAARQTLRLVRQPGCSYKAYWSVRAMAERARHHPAPTEGMRTALAVFDEWLSAPPPEPARALVAKEHEQRRRLAASCANAHARSRCADDEQFARLSADDKRDGLQRVRAAARSRLPFEIPPTSLVACFGGPGEHGYGTHACEAARSLGLPLYRCTCDFRSLHAVNVTNPSVSGGAFALVGEAGFTLRFDGAAEPAPTATLRILAPPGQLSLFRFMSSESGAPKAVLGGKSVEGVAEGAGAVLSVKAGCSCQPLTTALDPASRQIKAPSSAEAAPQPAAAGSSFAPCPVCGASVSLLKINTHLDDCLAQHR